MQRIVGLLGGSFDPPHNAHLAMAESFLRQFPTAEVILLPAGTPYHKPQATQTPAHHRLNMCLAAVANHPALSVSDIDMVRQGNTYTFDTVQIFREILPNTNLWWIMGEDSLRSIHQLKHSQALQNAVNFAVAYRGNGGAFDSVTQQIIEQGQKAVAENTPTGQIRFLDMPCDDISSTQIRQLLQQSSFRQPEKDILQRNIPVSVLQYIEENQLYQ